MLHLVNPVAERAIVLGDPGRALELAQSLLERPLMSNHQRGLWGYTGRAADGEPLTIQSTGTGGPSAVAVLTELAGAGVRRIVRAGSAIAVDPARPNVPHVVSGAVGADGASAALGLGPAATPEAGLTARLDAACEGRSVAVLSVDLLPQDGGPVPSLDGVDALDRQTAPLLGAAARLGVPAAAVVAFPRGDEDEAARSAWWRALGAAAAAAIVEAAPAAD